jgi:hypothetical protein
LGRTDVLGIDFLQPERLDTTAYAHKLKCEKPPIPGATQMPWTPNDAERHTRKAAAWELKELWAKVANESLERTGDEGRAIREANAVIARQAGASD